MLHGYLKLILTRRVALFYINFSVTIIHSNFLHVRYIIIMSLCIVPIAIETERSESVEGGYRGRTANMSSGRTELLRSSLPVGWYPRYKYFQTEPVSRSRPNPEWCPRGLVGVVCVLVVRAGRGEAQAGAAPAAALRALSSRARARAASRATPRPLVPRSSPGLLRYVLPRVSFPLLSSTPLNVGTIPSTVRLDGA